MSFVVYRREVRNVNMATRWVVKQFDGIKDSNVPVNTR